MTNNTETQTAKLQEYFGNYGGQYVPDAVKPALDEVADYFNRYRDDPDFNAELDDLLKNYDGW